MFAADILAAILLATASICSALKPPLTLMLLPLEPAATGAREEAVMSERTLSASARRASVDYTTLIAPGDPTELYSNFDKLGDGGYATVWSATDKQGVRVALKVMVMRDANLKSILDELAHHKQITHKNIVEFYHAYFVVHTASLWVALEYMGGGELLAVFA